MTNVFYDNLYNGNILLYIFALLLLLGLGIATLVGWWKIYVKMGLSGWLSLVPFYGYYVLCKKIGCKKVYWISLVLSLALAAMEIFADVYTIPSDAIGLFVTLYILLSIVSFVVTLKIMTRLSEAFGHGLGFAWGLSLLSTIFVLILGFDSSEYLGDAVD